MENGARNGNTCPPSPSRSPLFLAPIVHQISGIPMYEPTPIPRGYQLPLPLFLSRGKERSEKNGENAMRAGTTITLLPWLIGTKHIPEFKNSSQNPKHFPESKTHLRIQKHFPESKTRPKVVWILGCVFGFWNTFWILLSVFGFWEMFLNSAKWFEFWDVFCPYEQPYTTFVITWHIYLGSSTADHINLWFGIKWPPGRNERGEVSGIKNRSSAIELYGSTRSVSLLSWLRRRYLHYIYRLCCQSISKFSWKESILNRQVQAYIRLTMIILSADCIK